nr:immunoglobulin heavy chain junction region [Mus musculus]NSM03779.1 immunoglobulin heavy chain junction region [Mus musculus]NSM03807.1 immunoglobulin heavy chain junction region [Mus musculus]NSM03809.1 immunoglobulin heavy chain junction region [Mus musculus]NSM03827.1 immunoglobulin heavy chain junction region [Mus musculus]
CARRNYDLYYYAMDYW